jgi:hypothetical protein
MLILYPNTDNNDLCKNNLKHQGEVPFNLTFVTGDCHDPSGNMNMCVAGAISNFTSQLLHYKHGTSDRRCMNSICHFSNPCD